MEAFASYNCRVENWLRKKCWHNMDEIKDANLVYHHVGRELTSDWSANHFIMIVYEYISFKFQSEFSVQSTTKFFFLETTIKNYVRISQK